jgi:hypothetical protein
MRTIRDRLVSPEMQSGTWCHVGGAVIRGLPTPGEFP